MIILDKETRNAWIDMISKVYVNLHNSQRVLNSSSLSDKRRERIIKYFNRLEEVHNKVSETKSEAGEKLLKNFYYDLYVIKPENIPESYFNNQIELARERGYGNITLTDEEKETKIKQVIEDQKETLDKWIEYFLYDEESKSYEMWEKYWVFQGLQTLGKYDKETYKFSKRDKTTVYPFPPVEREYIFTTLKLMEDFIKDRKTEDEIKNALSTGNFKLLYEYVIKQSMLKEKNQSNSTDGKWIKYEQGSDYNILRNSLQGYYTGWCTAAGENFAKDQLAHGDFYVYYTLDNNGEAKVPRIAIRMDGSTNINEIRGIADSQNMEPEMMPILEEKLKEFPDREKYYKKDRDMKLLTLIDKKVNRNIELSLEELKFLYETDNEIEGFGYEKDPRIQEIQNKRNQKKDCALIYNISEDEVALSQGEWRKNPKQFKVLLSSLMLDHLKSADGLTLPKIIYGSLYLNTLTDAKNLTLPKNVHRSLYLNHLTSVGELILPEKIGKHLHLNRLTSAENLILPKTVGGSVYLRNLKNVKQLTLPEIVGENLYLDVLASLEKLIFPKTIGGNLYMFNFTNAKELILPKTVGGSVFLDKLISAEKLVLPETVGEILMLSSLISIKGIKLPKIVKGSLYLDKITSVEDLILPKSISKRLCLSSLTSAEGLILPQFVGGYIDLMNLQSPKGLKLPYGFNLNRLKCSDDVKNEILKNPEEYYMEPPIIEEKETGKRK